MKKNTSYKRRILNNLLVLILLILGVMGSIKIFSKSYELCSSIILENAFRPTMPALKEMTLTITSESTLSEIADTLYSYDLIKNKALFIGQGYIYKYDKKLQPGTYTLENNFDNVKILDTLSFVPEKEIESIRLTIPEGFTILDIANKVDHLGICSKNEFIQAATTTHYDFDFLTNLPKNIPYPLEGYLFPDTYFVSSNTSATELITMMLKRFEEISNLYTQYLHNSTYTLHDIVTIASIIEGEAIISEERPIISGVIYNRLNQQMQLQMCSTVQYSLENRKATLTYEDLKVESPYNTYLQPGLPIGPISSPGQDALKAAFLPAQHDYFYFVLQNPEIGAHAFSKTAEEHGQNKSKYQSLQDQNFMD